MRRLGDDAEALWRRPGEPRPGLNQEPAADAASAELLLFVNEAAECQSVVVLDPPLVVPIHEGLDGGAVGGKAARRSCHALRPPGARRVAAVAVRARSVRYEATVLMAAINERL
ncbi:hypothetical protein GCM10010307_75400 [Streptomyces vastus]|uniref:Transposase IS701-like DDE domain-containing protein n=1 Tax=Streptomyces vastus TaxID=285451 RepID=A0ABP6E570_9ACTN